MRSSPRRRSSSWACRTPFTRAHVSGPSEYRPVRKLSKAVLIGAVLLLAAYWGGLPGTAIPVGRASNAPEQEAYPGFGITDQESPEPREAQAPEDEAPAEADPPIGAVDDGGDGVPKAWIIIGAALLVLLVLLVGRVRASAAARSNWQGKAFDAYANGSAIHDALAVQVSGNSHQTGPAQRDVEHRMSDLTVQLHSLELTPPDSKAAAVLQDVLGALAALRWAAQADVKVRVSGAPDARQLEESAALARRRLGEFQATLAAFKTAI